MKKREQMAKVRQAGKGPGGKTKPAGHNVQTAQQQEKTLAEQSALIATQRELIALQRRQLSLYDVIFVRVLDFANLLKVQRKRTDKGE